MIFVFLSVITVVIGFLIGQHLRILFEREERDYTDNVKLGEALTAKLQEMQELKERMEMLLLKNGFGRK